MAWRIKNIFKQRPIFLAALFVLIVAALLFGGFFFKKPVSLPVNQLLSSTPILSATTTLSLLDGTIIPLEQASSTFFAAMIDNYTLPGLQFGLAEASLVFEAPVEGGITIFLAVYSLVKDIPKIGPIRSARPYFLDWAKEFNAFYLHVGGSPDALADIKEKNILDLNQYFNGQYYWRDSSRKAPHNVFTSTELLRQVKIDQLKFKKTEETPFTPWLFKEKEGKERGSSTSTFVVLGETKVEWRYDRDSNTYERYQEGKKQKDGSGQVIAVKNVAIIFTDITSIDEIDRQEIRTIGTGRALVLRDGREIAGSWEKKNFSSRTRFFGPDTKEIQFNPGVTWIEVTKK